MFTGTPRRVSLVALLLVAAGATLIGCASTPYTNRTQLLITSEGEEAKMGAQLYQETLSEGQVATGPQADRVRRIGTRIAAVSDSPDWAWEFNLLQSDEPNAFCLPGGKVAVYTGLLPVTENDDQLAAVMGHEIAHAILRHSGERMSQGMAVEAGSTVLAVLTGGTPESQQRLKGIYGVLGTGGILLPYSRKHESEADYVGLIYAARAGYDPRQAVQLWRNMAALGGSRPPEWLSTHPATETRIADLEARLPEVMPIYEQSRRGR